MIAGQNLKIGVALKAAVPEIGTRAIAAIIAAVVIAGALLLFGPWFNNNSTVTNLSLGTTTGQSSSIPVVTEHPATNDTERNNWIPPDILGRAHS